MSEGSPFQQTAAERMRARMRERRQKATPPPVRREASVQAFRAFTRILSKALYTSSHPDPIGYERFLEPEAGALEIAAKVRRALEASRYIDPRHPDWETVIRFRSEAEVKAAEERLMARAGVKTRPTLYKGAGNVSAILQDGRISLLPWRYRGAGHWEGFGAEPAVLPEHVSDEELGMAVQEELQRSRTA